MNATEIKELMEDIQTGGNKLWVMTDNFPESMKGSIAQRMWLDEKFSYGIEYGALIILNHLLEVQGSTSTARNKI